jgi:uncharacterized protein YdhG (YjbR/CyaY superfamily)
MDPRIKTIDQYIAHHPARVQKTLQKIRQTIHAAVPEATEKISYGLCTFTFHGNLVHFGAYDTHYGFYPGSGPIVSLAEELKPYKTAKGTVRFPLDKPVPYDLITKMTKAAAERNLNKRLNKTPVLP